MASGPALDCFHCGLPVPDGLNIEVEVLGLPRPMCCAGCAAVAETLQAQGLAHYYSHRESLPLVPAELASGPLPEADLADAPGLAGEWIRELDDEKSEALLQVEGLRCAACAWLVEERLRSVPGIESASVNLATHALRVVLDPAKGSLGDAVRALREVGFKARPRRADVLAEDRRRERRTALVRLGIAGLGAMNVMTYAVALYAGAFEGIEMRYEQLFRWASAVVTTPVLLVAGAPFFQGAWRDLRVRRPGMDVPIALAIGSAYVASLWSTFTGTGEVWFDSVCMFVFFLTLGGASRCSCVIAPATPPSACSRPARPPHASSRTATSAGCPRRASPSANAWSCAAGETIPCDGRVVEGFGSVAEALLNGEPWPRSVDAGAEVLGGSTNVDRPLVVEATRAGSETALSKVVALLGRAQSEKPPVVLRADRVARVFVAAVLVLAAGTAAVWSQLAPERAFEVTLSVLVATCPCALSLATPVALAAAQSALARAGLLVTRGHVIERLADADRFVFDKTGTLTRGEPTLVDGLAEPGHDRRRMLALAAELEARSEHPLARALRRAGRELGVQDASDRPFDVQHIEPVVGAGLEAQVDGETLRIGRPDWVAELAGEGARGGEEEQADEHDEAHVWIALGDAKGCRARFAFDDPMREEAPAALERLRGQGLTLELATGDPSPARRTSRPHPRARCALHRRLARSQA